jgi:hypothetical protein
MQFDRVTIRSTDKTPDSGVFIDFVKTSDFIYTYGNISTVHVSEARRACRSSGFFLSS